jgi:tetratricopeptide (TPR) repeat protein
LVGAEVTVDPTYKRVKTLFDEGQYREVVATYLRAASDQTSHMEWFVYGCGLYCPLAYAHLGDYDKAIEMFQVYLKNAPSRQPQLALQKCGPTFIARLAGHRPAPWYDLWNQMRREMAPIEALVEDLWSPDLERNDEAARQPIYEALRKYGKEAIPALLNALALNDWNYESREQERRYPKIALVNIGDPAFEALENVIFSKGKIDVQTEFSSRLPRAAIKMLWMFGDERAEPVLRRALVDPAVKHKDYIEEQLDLIEFRKRKSANTTLP